MRKCFAFLLLLGSLAAAAQTTVFNCGSGGTAWNNTTGACGMSNSYQSTGYPFSFFGNAAGANVTSGVLTLQPTGTNHAPTNVDYTAAAVGVTAFTTHFQFTANAWNTAFVLNNATHNAGAGAPPGFTLASGFSGGAGCEGGFYQAFGGAGNPPPNNIFVVNFDQGNLLVNSLSPFYSSVQVYQQVQSPCIPEDGSPGWFTFNNKVSSSPVAMDSPSTTYQTSTGHTYDATIIYTGMAVTVNMFDVTAGGTCSPVTSASCFTYTWPNISIPSLVDGTTAWVNLGASTNGSSPNALTIPTWSYSTLSPASTPTFSPAAGTYSSSQSVTISGPSGSTICYNTTGGPYTDGNGNCPNGTKYTGAISVTKGESVYAVAGSGSTSYGDSAVGSAAYNITGYATAPTFNQPGGTYQGTQSVYLTTPHGGVICYSTTTTPATNGSTGCATGTLYSGAITVSANETINAIAGGTGFSDSPVGSAAYVISPFAVVSTYTGSYPSNSPTFSVAPGTYGSTQSVTLASSTSGSNICYVASATPPTLLPEPDSLGGCAVGTAYTGAISVSSSTTIYAAAGTTIGALVAGTGPPSSVSQATYTISGGTASAPTFSPVAGTYTGSQTVTASTSTTGCGSYIYFDTNATPVTNQTSLAVAASETVYAYVHGCPGYSDSSISSAAYTINAVSYIEKSNSSSNATVQ